MFDNMNDINGIPEFSSLSTRQVLDGDKIKVDDVLNKKIIVTGFNVGSSKYKDKGGDYCLKVQFYFEDDESKEKHIFFSGSSVIKSQLEEMQSSQKDKLLFRTIVKKVGDYYSLT